MSEFEGNSNKKRFKTVTSEEKKLILDKRKAENTNCSTKQWINCLREYIIEKSYPDLDLLTDVELNDVLGNFYIEARKKKVFEEIDPNDPDDEEKKTNYKNSSLRSARAAFTRYFKDVRKVDIRTSEVFIESNEIFLGKTKDNKERGLGKIENKPPITDQDMETLGIYFKSVMLGAPNPYGLLQIVIFNIIYYLCRRGRENLRSMTKNTFGIATDPVSKKQYIYQKEDEADKNHSASDTAIANQGRIYEIPGK